MKGLVTAIRTLTIIRVPGKDVEKAAASLPFFPLVGGLVGCLVAGTAWLAGATLGWQGGIGIICVIIGSLVTVGLHLDGLADTFDSLGGRTVQRRLEIMKDSHIGSFGVVALILVVVSKIECISVLAMLNKWNWLVVPFIVSRAMQATLIVALPYARPEGGTAQRFVQDAKPVHAVIACLIGFGLAAAAGGKTGAMIMLCSLLVLPLMTLWMRRMFGGVTGDLVGMASEVFETGILGVMAFVL